MDTALDLRSSRPGTVGHAILEAADRWHDRTAFILGDRKASFADFARQSVACARNLLAQQVSPGEHIGILMPNTWEYIILASAINMIGACAVTLNARYRGEDLEYVVRHANVTVLFTTGSVRAHLDLRNLLCTSFPELSQWQAGDRLSVKGAPHLRKVFHFHAPDEKSWPTETEFNAAGQSVSDEILSGRIGKVRPDDNAMIIFSSGTTSQPKACRISHSTLTEVSSAIADRLGLVAEDVLWDPLPMYHLSSHLPLNACRQVGATFVSQGHFQAGTALAELERYGVTICYPAFPALTSAIIDHPEFKTRDLSKVRMMINIGPPELLRKFANAVPHATQISCYGLTEGGGISTLSSPKDSLEQRLTRAGHPLRTHQIRIVDPQTLADVPQGQRGEILIAGAIFSGYFNDAAQTHKVMLPDQWLRTGDFGWIDEEGHLAYAGRLKDMLKVGGENVSAVEVESFLARHPKIKMVQVIPAPDERLMEVVAAYIELNAGETMTETDVIEYCIGRMASYKVPRYVRFISEWPMGATKIQKFKLLEDFVPVGKINLAAFPASTAKA